MKVPDQLLVVAHHLGDLRDRVVFVGICRWIVAGVRVDVMPVDPCILGFSNVWYEGARTSSLAVASADGPIHILDAARFCATKLEAFLSRGNDDLHHHDLEDFVAVVDGRPDLVDEIAATTKEVRNFLATETSKLLARQAFIQALPGHLDGDQASQARVPLVLSRLRSIATFVSNAVPARARLAPSMAQAFPTLPAGTKDVFQHVFVGSSNLHSAAYDVASSTLSIRFNSGREYAYASVPRTVYAGLLLAASAGRYHHQWIRARYQYRRVK